MVLIYGMEINSIIEINEIERILVFLGFEIRIFFCRFLVKELMLGKQREFRSFDNSDFFGLIVVMVLVVKM